MPVQAGSMTMGQWAMISNSPLVQSVTMALIAGGNVMGRDIPFSNNETLFVNGVRFDGNLPAVNWANLNDDSVTVSSQPSPFQEQAYILRNSIDVDEFMVRDRNAIRDPRAVQLEFYLAGVTYDFNDKFINNDHPSGNTKAPVGLRYRINNGTIFGVRTENKIDAGGVDLSAAGLSAATANSLLEYIDQALWSVDAPDGSPNVVIYCNEVFKRRINRAVRMMGTQGGFAQNQDMYGRMVDTYKSCPVRDIGRKNDMTTLIIGGNGIAGAGAVGELATGLPSTGASATFTSLYIVNYNDGYFGGWQYNPLQAIDLGQLNTGLQFRTYVSWAGGLINYKNRSLARIFDIKLA
jgi:hypothetical protein